MELWTQSPEAPVSEGESRGQRCSDGRDEPLGYAAAEPEEQEQTVVGARSSWRAITGIVSPELNSSAMAARVVCTNVRSHRRRTELTYTRPRKPPRRWGMV
jgi:hypothetical protein